ncbi:hypothetical protein CVT26_013858 [Gymnopilus dilepis]|uniref:Uncharacterized protein n=1 Tax=Gymnopilus dilepis TaxID=231916 RepID=A0A409VVY1_9AGAR|nr:hypothetical protein CVT26_013858 [Gymnopilus dilepis]
MPSLLIKNLFILQGVRVLYLHAEKRKRTLSRKQVIVRDGNLSATAVDLVGATASTYPLQEVRDFFQKNEAVWKGQAGAEESACLLAVQDQQTSDRLTMFTLSFGIRRGQFSTLKFQDDVCLGDIQPPLWDPAIPKHPSSAGKPPVIAVKHSFVLCLGLYSLPAQLGLASLR